MGGGLAVARRPTLQLSAAEGSGGGVEHVERVSAFQEGYSKDNDAIESQPLESQPRAQGGAARQRPTEHTISIFTPYKPSGTSVPRASHTNQLQTRISRCAGKTPDFRHWALGSRARLQGHAAYAQGLALQRLQEQRHLLLRLQLAPRLRQHRRRARQLRQAGGQRGQAPNLVLHRCEAGPRQCVLSAALKWMAFGETNVTLRSMRYIK